MQSDLAHFKHVGIVRNGQCRTGVLLDQHDGHAGCAQALDGAEDFTHDQGRQPQTGLVEHEQARARHQRAAHGQHLALAPRHGASELQAPLLEARKQVIDRVKPVPPMRVGQAHLAVPAEQQVVFHSHGGK